MFTLEGGRILIKWQDLLLSSMLDAYNKDTSKSKSEAEALFKYIHICAQVDQDAPYYNAREDEIRRLARREVYRDYDYQFHGLYAEDQVEDMIQQYKSSKIKPEQRVIGSFNRKIDEIQELIDNTKPALEPVYDKQGNVSKYASNMAMIMKALTELQSLIKARDSLAASIKKEVGKGNIRGQKKPSRLEVSQ